MYPLLFNEYTILDKYTEQPLPLHLSNFPQATSFFSPLSLANKTLGYEITWELA
jgi:hypothetical protein